jgi:ABC-type sulfate transport system substrate-binding protein
LFVCVARAARLRLAQVEADKSSQELRRQLEAEFKSELAQKDAGDSSFTAQLKAETAKDAQSIDEGFNSNQQAVIDFLLHHVTTVNLEVSEALKQSLLTKAEQGTQ